MRQTCLDLVYELARADDRIVFVGSDLGAGTLDRFKLDLPERFFMEGISEANAVGLAAGLALTGKIVYLNTIAGFLTRRAFEQVVLDLCLHRLRVRLIGNGGGLVYAPLGPTHEVVEDLAVMRALPGMSVVAPADAAEMTELMPQSVDWPGPIYIRLAKGFDPVVTDDLPPFELGRARAVRPGRDALILTTGITLGPARAAAGELAGLGIEAAVVHLPTLKPLDGAAVLEAAGPVKAVVTVEEHSIIGGLGGAVAELLAEAEFDQPKRFRRIGLPDAFPDRYGSQAGLLTRYGITAPNVVATVRELLGRGR